MAKRTKRVSDKTEDKVQDEILDEQVEEKTEEPVEQEEKELVEQPETDEAMPEVKVVDDGFQPAPEGVLNDVQAITKEDVQRMLDERAHQIVTPEVEDTAAQQPVKPKKSQEERRKGQRKGMYIGLPNRHHFGSHARQKEAGLGRGAVKIDETRGINQ